MEDNNKDINNKDINHKDIDHNLLDHDYDGIKELDNSLPPWWVYLFYGTINFAIIYVVLFWGIGLFHQYDELDTEYQEAEVAINQYHAEQTSLAQNTSGITATVAIDENSVEVVTDPAKLEDGKAIYTKNCASCHALNGGGGIGPNLTDSAWLYGSQTANVFKSIKYGIPQNGMIAWEYQLNPEQIQNVTSYILTELKDKNVAGGKAPQGNLE